MHTVFKSPSENAGAQRDAFTLVELLVSMSVLVVLILLVVQITNSASSTATKSDKQITADQQAQIIFSQMATDFSSMVRRRDVDTLFWKNDAGNDAMFFFTEGQGFFSSSYVDSHLAGELSFTGYRVTNRTTAAKNGGYDLYPNHVLDRVSRGLDWSPPPGGNTSDAEEFLVFFPGVAVPDGKDVLKNKPGELTLPITHKSFCPPPTYDNPTEEGYTNVLADGVYRMEFCYQLKDGTLSNVPVLASAGALNKLNASAPPTLTDDVSQGYVAGASRWWCRNDAKGIQRGYLCTSSAKGAARWSYLGLNDVSSIIVAIAILEHNNRKTIKPDSTAPSQIDRATMAKMVAALPDSKDPESDFALTPPKLIAQKWTLAMNKGTFAKDSGDIPVAAASQVRIYQRAFNLESR
jgi:prepilin-type N-terminal cleavage/methylation domain-containing protein